MLFKIEENSYFLTFVQGNLFTILKFFIEKFIPNEIE